jgi:membrane protein DedA with SNARE-associated domain
VTGAAEKQPTALDRVRAWPVRRVDLVLGAAGVLLLVVPLPARSPDARGTGLFVSIILLLAIEEGGVPLPVPGDFGVVYLGYLIGRGLASPWQIVPALLAAVLTGATFLYGVGRWWGGGLLAPLLRRVPPARLDRARRMVERYGVLAVALARAVPGMRIAVSLLAGSVQIPYLLFVGGVGLCSSLWIVVLLVAGSRLGTWAGGHLNVTAIAPGLRVFGLILLLAACASFGVRLWRSHHPSSG